MQVKLHKSYRTVLACCDSDLLGKKFIEGQFMLDVRENFYKDLELNKEQTIKMFERQAMEDATFNIVGKESVAIALELGIIEPENIRTIKNIPFALSL